MTDTAKCVMTHTKEPQDRPARRGHLCTSCYHRLEQELAELPALSSWLHANLAEGSSAAPNPMRVTSRENWPVPIATDVHDHLEDIHAKLASWCLNVCDDRDLQGPGRSDVNATAAFLLAHLDWSSEQPWADAFAVEIHELHRDAHALVPVVPQTHRLDLPCPDCQTTTITRTDGADYARCESCGRLWKEREYQWLCKRVAREQEDASGWLLPEVVAAIVDVNPKTLRTWARRGVVATVCNVLPGKISDERLRVHPLEVAVLVAWDEALAEQAKRNAGHGDEQRSA
jgi:ribosomal protein S27E